MNKKPVIARAFLCYNVKPHRGGLIIRSFRQRPPMVQTFNGDYLIGDKMKTDLVTKDLTTTSLALAELFGREHRNILRVIRNIIKDMDTEELTRRKIEQCTYLDVGFLVL